MIVVHISSDAPDPSLIAQAADVLRHGGLVIYPTDTFYGVAADPRRDDAVERLFDAKGRDAGMALPLIASSAEQAEAAAAIGARERRLMRAFWPGPLTLVLPARDGLSPRVAGVNRTVAIRVPAHAVARALAESVGFCITATSANRSGQPPGATAGLAAGAFGRAIDLVLDAGPTTGNLPSTIVEIAADGPRLVRAGAIAWERVLESLK